MYPLNLNLNSSLVKRHNGIPISDSSSKEVPFTVVLASRWYLKGHIVLISSAPNLGNTFIYWYCGLIFQTSTHVDFVFFIFICSCPLGLTDSKMYKRNVGLNWG